MKANIICQICGKSITHFSGLAKHIKTKHNILPKEYYDKFLKQDNEGICLNCKNQTTFIKLAKGYHKYCSRQCANENPEKKHKAEETIFQHFGVRHPSQSKVIRQKQKQTCLNKYGATTPFSVNCCREKAKQTSLKRYGETSYTKTQEYRLKSKETSLRKYGYESPNQSPIVQKKQQDTCYKNYGVKNCQQSYIVQQQTQQTIRSKYGKSFYTQTDEYTKKRIKTSNMHYGVDHPMQCREVMLKTKQKFKKDGKIYDSSWEYYFEQYLIQHNIKFKYQPDIYFWYEFNGKKHRYYPDFAIYNNDNSLKEIIDIKGDHLMKQMLNPSTKEHQKYLCILANNIRLLHKKDLQKLGIKI